MESDFISQDIIDKGFNPTKIIQCEKCNRIPFIYLISKDAFIYECSHCKITKSQKLDSIENDLMNNKVMPKCDRHENDYSVKYCLECEKNLCSACISEHSNFNQLHHLYNFPINLKLRCKKHDNKIDRICNKCKEELCYECVNNKEHKDHFSEIHLINEILNEKMLKEIKNKFEDAQKKINYDNEELLNNYNKQLDKEVDKINNEYQEKEAKIEKDSEEKIKNYQKLIEEYNSNIENEKKNKENSLIQQKKIKDELINLIKNNKKNLDDLYQNNKNNNKLLIKYFNLLLDSYNDYFGCQNYNASLNIRFNGKFNTNRFKYIYDESKSNEQNYENYIKEYNIDIDLIFKKNDKLTQYFSNDYIITSTIQKTNLDSPINLNSENQNSSHKVHESGSNILDQIPNLISIQNTNNIDDNNEKEKLNNISISSINMNSKDESINNINDLVNNISKKEEEDLVISNVVNDIENKFLLENLNKDNRLNDIDDENFDKCSIKDKIAKELNLFNKENSFNVNELIFCIKCKKIPLILFSNEQEIICHCENCSIYFKIKIENLLDNLALEKKNTLYSALSSDEKLNKCHKTKEHESRQSSKFCLDCQKYFCIDCINKHNNGVDDHTVIENFLDIQIRCNTHNNNFLEYKCQNCNKELCTSCYYKDEHYNNGKFDIIISYDKLNQDIENIINDFKDKKEKEDIKNNKLKEEVKIHLGEENKQKENEIKENLIKIEEEYNEKINRINEQIKSLESQKQDEENNKIKKIENVQEEKKNFINRNNELVKTIENKYNENLQKNNKFVKLFNILISNYQYYNGKYVYNSIMNLINNYQVNNIDISSIKNNPQKVIEYFEKYYFFDFRIAREKFYGRNVINEDILNFVNDFFSFDEINKIVTINFNSQSINLSSPAQEDSKKTETQNNHIKSLNNENKKEAQKIEIEKKKNSKNRNTLWKNIIIIIIFVIVISFALIYIFFYKH